MSEFIIIAGPQAAGKSTAIASLNEQYQNISLLLPGRAKPLIFPLQESRQIVVHANMLLGGIFMTREHEIEVIDCDFRRMDMILSRRRDHLVYIDECNIFTIAHAIACGVKDAGKYWQKYIDRLKKLNAKVIFLDVPPDISWERRSRKYEQRLVYFPKKKHKKIMAQYQDYLKRTYHLLKDVYSRLPFPKEIINAQFAQKTVIHSVSESLARLSGTFK